MKKLCILGLLAISSLHLEGAFDGKNSGEELKNLYQNAEQAMRLKDFARAKQHYTDLLQSSQPSSVDIFYYADVCIRLSFVEKELGLLDESEKRLCQLLYKPLPDDLFLRAKLLLAKVLQAQKKEEEAYLMLVQLQSQHPFEKWLPEERGYFVMLQDTVSEQYQLLLCQATRLFEASLYQESAQLLQELMQKIEAGKYPNHAKDSLRILNLLARAHFNSKNFGKVIALLQPKKEALLAQNDDETLVYLAKAYKELGSFSQAKELFDSLDQKKKSCDCSITLEKGQTEFLLGSLNEAKKSLEKLLVQTENQNHEFMAKLLLSKIYLKEQNFKQVQNLIAEDTARYFESSSPDISSYFIKYELAYLLAESYFATSEFESAAYYYEKSIPLINKDRADWIESANLKKGSSYLKLSSKDPKFLDSAIETFRLLRTDESITEKATIGLCWALALKGDKTTSDQSNELKNLLNDSSVVFSNEGKAELLLIKAQLEPIQENKFAFYKLLIEQAPLNGTLAGKRAWFFKSEVMLELVKELKKNGNNEYLDLLKRNINDLEKSFILLHEIDPETASLSLFNKAYCYNMLGSEVYSQKGLIALEQLIDSKLFDACPKKAEALYLYIQILCNSNNSEDDSFIKKAEKALLILQEIEQDSTFFEKSIFIVATLCYEAELYDQAEDLFYKSYQLFPSGDNASQSLFFAALCNERSEVEKELKANFFRRLILQIDPQGPFADEAYLRLYAFSEYVQGEKEAINHLKKMPELYPQSQLLPITYFLLGLHAKETISDQIASNQNEIDDENAYTYFLKTISCVEELIDKNNVDQKRLDELITIYYKAINEYAWLAIEEANKNYLEKSISLLNKTIDLFLLNDNPLTKGLNSQCSYPRTLEECQYLLAKSYWAASSLELCQKTLEGMVKKYEELNITQSYYLALAYFELGKLQAKKQQHNIALNYFLLCQESSINQIFNGQEKLNLWMQASSSARAIGRFDEAMLYLSYVINENISSSTRIEAMLLRSDLYQLQGRHELAIKQLEAVSKNGGEFALIAKEKLKENYGFE